MADDPPFAGTVRELRQLTQAGAPPPPPPVDPHPAPGDDPNMEARVKRLEDDVRAMRSDLTVIIGRLGAVEGKLDTLLTQVGSKVPSGLQMFGIIVGTLVAGVRIFGGALGVAQWLKLIPR
jgi:hypothetical protein